MCKACRDSTAVAWTFVMRHLTLATIGVIYAMCMILFLALMGVVFNEPVTALMRADGESPAPTHATSLLFFQFLS